MSALSADQQGRDALEPLLVYRNGKGDIRYAKPLLFQTAEFLVRSTQANVYLVDTTHGVPHRAIMKVNLPRELLGSVPERKSSAYENTKVPHIERTRREAGFLNSLQHPYIARYEGTLPLGNLPANGKSFQMEGILMDYKPDGMPLSHFIAGMRRSGRVIDVCSEKKDLPLDDLETILDNLLMTRNILCDVVGFLDELGITHQDFKPENLIVVADRYGRIRDMDVIDFGSAYYNERHDTKSWGDRLYSPPARFLKAPVADPNRDKWSIALILYEMLTGEHMFVPCREKAAMETKAEEILGGIRRINWKEVYKELGIRQMFGGIHLAIKSCCDKVKKANERQQISRISKKAAEINPIGDEYMEESFAFAAEQLAKDSH